MSPVISEPELLGRVLSRTQQITENVVALGAVCTLLLEAEEKLRELHGLCHGCDCPRSRCGPVLWTRQQKCCPDCTHGVMHD